MIIPEKYHHVKYVTSVIPDLAIEPNVTNGANCQVFAYSLLREFGLKAPLLRSSELWVEDELTQVVTDFEPLDIMLYNKTDEAYGAHVGVYVVNQSKHLT